MEAIKITSALNAKLLADAGITELVEDKIFPVAVTKSCTLPFVSITRTNCGYQDAKSTDTAFEQYAEVTVLCVSRSYAEGVEIASRVADSLSGFSGDVSTGTDVFHISQIKMVSSAEDYDDENDLFTQAVNIAIEIDK